MQAPTVSYFPGEMLLWAHHRRGPVFSARVGRQRYHYLMGPAANAFIFANDKLFRVREAFAALIPIDGPTSLIVSDGADHTRRRQLVQPGLHQRQVNSYLEIMATTADQALDAQRPGEPFDAYAVFRAAIRRSTLRALFGERMAAQADAVGNHLQPLLDIADRLPDLIAMHQRLQTPFWRRAMHALARLNSFIYGEIARIKAQGDESESQVLATLIYGRDGTGSGLTDQEIRDQMVTMIAAGYETTSAAMAWILYALGGRPEVQAQARAEVAAVTGGAPPTTAHLPQLKLLNAILLESLRLYPPAVISARYVAESFTFAGHAIPAGAMLIYSPYVTHRSPAVYADPRAFRPERWLGDAPRRSGAEFLPFGGGIHRCVGSMMATTELTVILARLLARTAYTLEDQRVRAKSLAAMRPRNGLWIRLAATSA